jgi:hypothetical protein
LLPLPAGESWGGGSFYEFELKDLHKNIKQFAFIAGYRTQTITPQTPVNIKNWKYCAPYIKGRARASSTCIRKSAWIRPFLGAEEFINNIPRWCLWLPDIAPNELRAMPYVLQRVEEVKKVRLASSYACSIGSVDRPTQFERIRQPRTDYLAVPEVSSGTRRFLPIGFLDATIIASNKLYTISDAGLYEFGILSSTIHNAWMRYTCGRLKSDYQYSPGIVYNNLPWPNAPTDKQRTTAEAAAQGVLDARAQFQQSSLADLYSPLTMPPALVKAH